MINPFDKNFFRFLLGFTCILVFSFSVLYFTGIYKDVLDGKKVVSNIIDSVKMPVEAR
jgi:hypothetical protein